MASIEEILGKNINSIKELRAEIKNLQDSLIGVDADSEQFKTTSQQLAAAQEELTKVTRAGKEENNAAKDSIVGMKNEYKALYDQYKLLSDEQRNSDFGKNMAESLETLSSKINDTQKGVGSFKDNIGNYTASVSEAFNKMGISIGGLQGPFKAAQTASGGLNTAFKTLAANPIMIAITAIVAILVKAAAAIKQNEELTMRLQQALSVFKPVLDAISNAFDFLAGIIVKVVEGFAKFSAKVLSIIPGMNKAIKSHQELAKATDELTKKQRENEIVNSQKQADIERLREEASATDDVIEKQRLLEEAKAKQAEIDQANIEIAQEELRIMQEYSEKTANSAEENEKLAAAQKKVNDAIAQGEKNARMYNKQLDAVTQTTSSAGNSVEDYKKKAKELHEQLIEDNKDELTKLTEKYEKEKKLLEKYHYDTKLLTEKYENERTTIIGNAAKNSLQERRASYNKDLESYSRHISLVRELLQDDPVGLANFEKQISEEILERFDKIEDAALKIQPKLREFNEEFKGYNSALVNAFTFIKQDNIKDISDYAAGVELLTNKMKNLVEYANKPNTANGIMYNLYKQAKEQLELYGPENWEKTTRAIQEQVDSLRTAYGVAIEAGDESDRIIEIQKKNIAQLEKVIAELPAQLAGEEQLKKIQDAISKNYEQELEGLIKTVSYDTFNGYTVFMAEQEAKALEIEKTALEDELSKFSGTTEQKLQIMQRYYEVLAEMRENDHAMAELSIQRVTEMFDNLIDMTDKMASSLSSYKSTRESVIDSELKAGKISEAEAAKQKKRLLTLERLERDFAIATIAADAAAGLFSIWKGYATEVGTINAQTAAAAGPGAVAAKAALDAKSLVSAIAKSAGLAATATAQIAAAQGKYVVAKNNMSAESGGGSVGVAAAPMLIDSSPVSWTQQVQNTPVEDEFNKVNLWVSVSDIDEALNHKVAVTDESSF